MQLRRIVFRLLFLGITAWLGACASVPLDADKPTSVAIPAPGDTRIDHRLEQEGFQLASEELSGVRMLVTGHEAWEDRLRLIQLADRSLDLQYFSWADDESGRVMLSHVVDAADRGVRVRLLIDDMLAMDQTFFSPLQRHPNIDIRLFNPFATQRVDVVIRPFEWLAKERLNIRMHNKIMLADGTVGIIGGRNIQNRYFWVDPKFVHRDLDVLAVGAIVPVMADSFDEYWNSRWSIPLHMLERIPDEKRAQRYYHELRQYREKPSTREWFADIQMPDLETYQISNGLVQAPVELLVDRADKVASPSPWKYQQLSERIHSAGDHKVLLGMAYVVPDEDMMLEFQTLEQNGVDIKLLTNSMAAIDFSAAFSGWVPYRERLLDMGVEVYEFAVDASWPSCRTNCSEGHKSYHSKLIVIDDDLSYVGSMNYDPRSIQLNTEAGLLIHGEEFARLLTQVFYDDAESRNSWRLSHASPLQWTRQGENGESEVADDDPDAPFSRWLGVKFWGIMPFRDQY